METDRETEIKTRRRETDRVTERQTGIGGEKDKHVYGGKDRETGYRRGDGETDKETGRQTGRRGDQRGGGETNSETDREVSFLVACVISLASYIKSIFFLYRAFGLERHRSGSVLLVKQASFFLIHVPIARRSSAGNLEWNRVGIYSLTSKSSTLKFGHFYTLSPNV